MLRPSFLFLGLLALAPLASSVSIGDQLSRSYKQYVSLPSTAADAIAQGWTAAGACEEKLGIKYTLDKNGPTKNHPIALYFTPAGQSAGVGTMAYGEMPSELVDQGFWQEVGDEQYYITVTFRGPADACSTELLDEPLGERLVVNQNSIAFSIPTEENDPELTSNYAKGSCFETMGYHWFHDLTTGSEMSWSAANLMPVVPMFNNGRIHAFFFASWTMQQSLIHGSRWWEPVPLINYLMCKNWCDDSCTFSDTWLWSTMHIFLNEPMDATCPGGCTIACCSEDDSGVSAAVVAPVALGAVAVAGIVMLVGFRSRRSHLKKPLSGEELVARGESASYINVAARPTV